MDVVAQRRLFVDGLDDFANKITRMGRGETDTAHPGDVTRLCQKLGEVPCGRRRVPVAVYVLAEQLNFGIPGVDQRPCLAHHALASSATLGAPGKRNDAIRTSFVAAFYDSEISAVGIIPPRERSVESIGRIEA